MLKRPYVQTSEQPDQDVIRVRLNKNERIILDSVKEWLDVKHDSTALKIVFISGANVLHSVFGEHPLKYLFKKERPRFGDIDDIRKDNVARKHTKQ